MAHLIIIGAQKAGTTTLFDCLAPHPDIATANKKEVNFFGFQFERGLDWYLGLFDTGDRIKLDASPQYLHISSVAQQLRLALPDANLVCLIRDPIARAISNYRFNLARGLQDPSESFTQSVKTSRGEDIYLRKGLYAQQLGGFDSFFDAGQLLLIDFADLAADQRNVTNRVCSFAGLRDMPANMAMHSASNKTAQVSRSAAKLIYHATQFKQAHQGLYNALPDSLKRSLGSMKTAVKRFSRGHVSDNRQIPEATQAELVRYFVNDLKALREKYNFEAAWQSEYLNSY